MKQNFFYINGENKVYDWHRHTRLSAGKFNKNTNSLVIFSDVHKNSNKLLHQSHHIKQSCHSENDKVFKLFTFYILKEEFLGIETFA